MKVTFDCRLSCGGETISKTPTNAFRKRALASDGQKKCGTNPDDEQSANQPRQFLLLSWHEDGKAKYLQQCLCETSPSGIAS